MHTKILNEVCKGMVNTGIMAAKQTNEIERYTNIEVASNENTVNGLPTTYNMMYQPEI